MIPLDVDRNYNYFLTNSLNELTLLGDLVSIQMYFISIVKDALMKNGSVHLYKQYSNDNVKKARSCITRKI